MRIAVRKIIVGTVNASDPDLDPPGESWLISFFPQERMFLLFQISKDGKISTVMSLDYEFHAVYRFLVFVKVNGGSSLKSGDDITVEVSDENDNVPYFTSHSTFIITHWILTVTHFTLSTWVSWGLWTTTAGRNFLKYEIAAGNDRQCFAVNHITGLLSFTQGVTQQDSSEYDLLLTTRNSGMHALSSTIILLVILFLSNSTLLKIRNFDLCRGLYWNFVLIWMSWFNIASYYNLSYLYLLFA